ncbi:hypothetical protein AAFN88_14995 [Pelagibius sp. CAU 1746]|uniref:hypothetical protein n=1 Tax=Pelagibius sp. CAU 1746 TaxID=3140370 RepID=UPI00325BD629
MGAILWKLSLVVVGTLVLTLLAFTFEALLGHLSETFSIVTKSSGFASYLVVFGIACFLALGFMGGMVHWMGHFANPIAFFRAVDEHAERGRQVLILPLSGMKNREFNQQAAVTALESLTHVDLETICRGGAGDQVLQQAMRHPWVQGFRALFPHRETLRRLYVIPSDVGDAASAPDAWRFAKAVFDLLDTREPKIFFVGGPGEIVPIERSAVTGAPGRESTLCTTGVNYGDYHALQVAFRAAIRHAGAAGFAKRSLCIDMTAGTKQVSVAAAVAALNTQALFSYVGNDGRLHLDTAILDPGLFSEEFI